MAFFTFLIRLKSIRRAQNIYIYYWEKTLFSLSPGKSFALSLAAPHCNSNVMTFLPLSCCHDELPQNSSPAIVFRPKSRQNKKPINPIIAATPVPKIVSDQYFLRVMRHGGKNTLVLPANRALGEVFALAVCLTSINVPIQRAVQIYLMCTHQETWPALCSRSDNSVMRKHINAAICI